MKKKQIAFLKEIVETPSPTGNEVQVAEIVRQRLLPIADEIRTDTMGSVHVTYEGALHHRAATDPGEPDLFEDSGEFDDLEELEEFAEDDGFGGMQGELGEDGSFAGSEPARQGIDVYDEFLGDEGAEDADGENVEGDVGDSDDSEAMGASGDEDDARVRRVALSAAASDGGIGRLDDADESSADEGMLDEDARFDRAPLTLMLAAHMDEIGLMVTYISKDGFLSVSSVGGVDPAILPGMRVDVHTAKGILRGVVGRKPIHLIDADDRKSVTPLDKLVIDLGMPAKKVKQLVRVGDPITFGVGFEEFGRGMAVSRAFDDKVGVFITCRVMEKLAKAKEYTGTFVGAVTVQEEIGTRGAMTSAHAIRPDVALAFDVTHATDYPGIDKSKHGDIVCGGGPVIARGPNINPVVFERLVAAAEAEGIPYQLEAEPSVTGTDARAIQVTRDGIPTGLVSVPLRYMHTPTEVISLEDVDATIRLITRFAIDLDDAEDFVPGHALDYESIEKIEAEPADEDYEYLIGEVERLSDELADLQVMAEFGLGATDFDDDAEAYNGPSEFTPDSAPFGRQQSTINAEFAALDLGGIGMKRAQQAYSRGVQPTQAAVSQWPQDGLSQQQTQQMQQGWQMQQGQQVQQIQQAQQVQQVQQGQQIQPTQQAQQGQQAQQSPLAHQGQQDSQGEPYADVHSAASGHNDQFEGEEHGGFDDMDEPRDMNEGAEPNDESKAARPSIPSGQIPVISIPASDLENE